MIGLLKKAIVDLPIKMKGNSKRTSGNSLSPLGAQNKELGTASQTLLTEVKLRGLRRRLTASIVIKILPLNKPMVQPNSTQPRPSLKCNLNMANTIFHASL